MNSPSSASVSRVGVVAGGGRGGWGSSSKEASAGTLVRCCWTGGVPELADEVVVTVVISSVDSASAGGTVPARPKTEDESELDSLVKAMLR